MGHRFRGSVLLLASLATLSLGAAPRVRRPATSSATQPTTSQVELAHQRVERAVSRVQVASEAMKSAQAAVDQQKAVQLEAARQTPQWRSAAAELSVKASALDDARKNGTPQQKLDASSAWVKAKAAVKQIEDASQKIDAEAPSMLSAESARQELRSAQASLDQAKAAEDAAQSDAEAADPIRRAIRENRVVRGMTIAEARRVKGPPDTSYENDAGLQVLEWRSCAEPRPGEIPRVISDVTAIFRDGKCVKVEEIKHDP